MPDIPVKPPEVQSTAAFLEDHLNPDFMAEAGKFIRSPLWQDFKRVMLALRPPSAIVTDDIHVAAAKGFQSTAWMDAIDTIEKLPFKARPVSVESFIPEALRDTKD
jgi:hypothetical protein